MTKSDGKIKRAEEIALCYLRNNNDKYATSIELGIKESTITREVNRYKAYHKIITPPKILITDIETAQMLVKVWGLYKQRIDPRRIVKDWFILMWAAKWLRSNEILGDCVSPKEAKARNDKRILESIWKYLNEADIIVGHNINRFDIRKINARFFYHKILPPSQYQTVDTLKHSQKNFAFSSHKLDYITKYRKMPSKLETGIELWDK